MILTYLKKRREKAVKEISLQKFKTIISWCHCPFIEFE